MEKARTTHEHASDGDGRAAPPATSDKIVSPSTLDRPPVSRLEEVLVMEELTNPVARLSDHSSENRALVALMRKLAGNPKGILQKLCEVVMELCRGQSAGVSTLEVSGAAGVIRWHAAAGQMASIQGSTIHREQTACGTVIAQNRTLLFDQPDRFFPVLRTLGPTMYRVLIAPWEVDGQVRGTVWVATHLPEARFDAEDGRVLSHLARFAAVAYSLLQGGRKADEMRAERSAALNLMEDAVAARRETEQATTALRSSEERFRMIVESAREYAIFSTDLHRHIVSWNPGAERMLGHHGPEIVGRTADLVFTPEDIAAEVPAREVSKALKDGSCVNERWHLRKDGTRFWGSGMTMSLRGPDGETIGFLKIMRDHTEQVRAQKELEATRDKLEMSLQAAAVARDEAEIASRAKDHFLAVLSHELRTPLTPVLLAVRRLTRRTDITPAAQDALEMIRRNVELESRLIDDLLDLTRISRGTLEIVRAPLDLHDVVRDALDVVTPEMEAKDQKLTTRLEAKQTPLDGDAARLQQVFWNVLRNASKFTPVGGSISLISRDEPGRIVVEVGDSGIGFEPEDSERIFNAFVQASPRVGRQFGGLGLGLAISRATVEAHGGTIRAGSEGPDRGATFIVEIPTPKETPAES